MPLSMQVLLSAGCFFFFFPLLICFCFFFIFSKLPRPQRSTEPEREQSLETLGPALKRTFPEKNGVKQF